MNMKTNAKTGQTAERRVLRRGITLALFLSLAFCGIPEAAAQKVRVAMPAKSMTFLNFYVGDKFGVYKAEGLDVSLEVIKTDVGVAGMVAGEIDYTTAIGSAMRAAATGVPIKATMFSMDRVLIYMFAKPSIKSIEELKGGKTVSTTGLLATPTSAAKVMARAHGLNPEKVIGLWIDEFTLDRKTAALSLKEIIKVFTRDGTTPEDAVKAEIKEIREQAKIKNEIPVSQVLDYKLLEEVLAEGKR